MKFLHIDPTARTVSIVEGKQPKDVYPWPSRVGVDHGVVEHGIGIIVYEFGLLEGDGPYFAIGRQLFSGDAILYGYDEAGDTVDVSDSFAHSLRPLFLPNREAVEVALLRGPVVRPVAKVNNVVTWEWNR